MSQNLPPAGAFPPPQLIPGPCPFRAMLRSTQPVCDALLARLPSLAAAEQERWYRPDLVLRGLGALRVQS
jgi:hypothetical protein